MMGSMMRRAMLGDGSTLWLDFTQMSTLADLTSRGLTFSRSTSGTFINASGLVATATAGNPRFDYDPSTRQPRGLLIEGASSNYLLASDDYSGWAGANSAVADETGATAPDGTSTPDRISDNSTNGEHYRSRSPGLTTAGTYTMSMWFKNPSTNGRRYAGLQLFAGGGTDTGGVVAVWDFDTGAATSTTGYGGKGTPALVAATPYQNGWWKATLSITVTGTLTTINARILLSSNGTSTVYANSGTALGILAYGAQLEAGSGSSSYIPTGASTGSRAADVCTMSNITALNYNANGGTLFAHFSNNTENGNFAGSIGFNNGANYAQRLRWGTGSLLGSYFQTNGTTALGSNLGGSRTSFASAKAATSYSFNGTTTSTAMSINGAQATTTPTSSAVSGVSIATAFALNSDNSSAATAYPSLAVRSVKFYPTALTMAQMNAITANP